MRLECHIERCLVKVLAEEPQRGLTLRREGLAGLRHDKKPARSGSGKGRSIYPPCPMAVPRGGTAIHRGGQFRLLSHPLDSALDSPYPSFIQELFLLPISNSKDLYGRSGVFVLTCVLPGTSLAS